MLESGHRTGNNWFPTKKICSYGGETISESIYGFPPADEFLQYIKTTLSLAGLPQSFTVMAANVPTVAAVVDDDQKLLLYNPIFLEGLKNDTNGASWTIISHAVGHLLQGHTLEEDVTRQAEEIEADQFSGSIQYKLGNGLSHAQYILEDTVIDESNSLYPPQIGSPICHRRRLDSYRGD